MYLHKGEPPEVQAAYISIAEFFDTYALAVALHRLRYVLTVADSYKHWPGTPSDVLYFCKKLETLVGAAITISKYGRKREAALTPLAANEAPNLADEKTYCGWHYRWQSWYYVPRHITKKEWANPYRVFKAVTRLHRHKGWKVLLKEMQWHALSTSAYSEGDGSLSALQLYFLLAKLIEAAHLVDVRAVNEIGGEPRPKWKGSPTKQLPENDAV